MNRIQKLALLNQVFQGDTGALKQQKAKRGRRWSPAEIAEHRSYLNTLCPNQEAGFIEQARLRLFGDYDRSSVPVEGTRYCRELPNGWKVYKPE